MCGNCAAGCGGEWFRAGQNPIFESLRAPHAAVGAPLIVEEKPIWGLALTHLLAEIGGLGPATFATSLEEALDLAETTEAPLMLVDLFTIGFDFEGLRRIATVTKGPVVAIDERPNPTFSRLARHAGARGYACKSVELDRFRAILRSVLEGEVNLPPEKSPRLPSVRTPRGSVGLSRRQLEVLRCIAVGMSNQEIARTLGITAGTVKLHIHTILRLTGTRNRTEAALMAGRFLPPDGGE